MEAVVFIDRGTYWGNPHPMGRSCPSCHGHPTHTREEAIAAFKRDWESPKYEAHRRRALKELWNKVLVCWCAPRPCHGHVIAEFVNAYYARTDRP